MSTIEIDEKQIVRYLLDQLPQSEADRLDELCFIDEDFSVRLQISEDDLIDSYTRGQLRDDERKQFEKKYLAVSHLRERVKFAQILNDKIKIAETDWVQPQLKESIFWPKQLLNYLSWPPISFRPIAITIAVAIISSVGAILFYVVFRDQNKTKIAGPPITPTPVSIPSPMAPPSINVTPPAVTPSPPVAGSKFAVFVLSPGTRGSANSRSFFVPRKIEKVILRLNLNEVKYKLYRVILKTARDEITVLTSGSLTPTTEKTRGVINVTIPANKLASRTYVIILKGLGEGQTPTEHNVSEYTFKITRE